MYLCITSIYNELHIKLQNCVRIASGYIVSLLRKKNDGTVAFNQQTVSNTLGRTCNFIQKRHFYPLFLDLMGY